MPGPLMRLLEAAPRAGIQEPVPFLARPTSMALPAALTSGITASTGCIGNRMDTDLWDGELYVVIPGRELPKLAAEAQSSRRRTPRCPTITGGDARRSP